MGTIVVFLYLFPIFLTPNRRGPFEWAYGTFHTNGQELNSINANDITGLIIAFALGILLVVISIVLPMGRGDFIIAGYNTTPAEKKKNMADWLYANS